MIPCGLAAGRIGNFINGELWGRPTDLPWGMIFPQAGDNIPRHPSQLYQFALEGVALFIILWLFSRKPRPMGAVSGAFLIGYGGFRFLAEFAREPDTFLGLLALNFSMGQWLEPADGAGRRADDGLGLSAPGRRRRRWRGALIAVSSRRPGWPRSARA